MKKLASALCCLALWLVAARAQTQDMRPSPGAYMDALMWGKQKIGAPFKLMDHNGAIRSDAEFHGRFVLLYFGYTHCPDICPTDLMSLAGVLRDLGAQADRVQVLFVTLDPERDTPALMKDYLQSFDERIIGLTGARQDIDRLANSYKVWFAKSNETSADAYTIDHMAFVYLLDAGGKYIGFLPPGTPSQRIVAALRAAFNK